MAIGTRDIYCVDGECYYSWWQSQTGIIVRWVVFFVILALFLLYVIGGTFHARRRMRKGLEPLGYHRFLVRRRFQAPPANQQWPANQQPGVYYYQHPQQTGCQPAYPMNDMPLPAYDPNRPPVYSGPPEGGSKVDPSQNRTPAQPPPETNGAQEYAPPQGPPPPNR
ncbi:hypothetical protein E4U42_001551 [Claviceps africana]|uniref:Uncharacterized protein n=1 Tax=Claviceps africana TaxID=83212 RepID=A0A8K0NHZ3_9HYPO|nr:hypothetical protein E4U42_001551 [Claviceps africana]